MTRKRFIKLLMANGYGRNEAHKLAKQVPPTGNSYRAIYSPSRTILRLNLNLAKVTRNVSKLTNGIIEAAASFAKFAAAITPHMISAAQRIQSDLAAREGIKSTYLDGYGIQSALCDERDERFHQMEQLAIDTEGAEHGQPAL